MIDSLHLSKTANYSLGGKANSLIKLTLMGLPVPEFFVVPNTYFKDFVKYNHLENKINELALDKKYGEIKQLVISSDFDDKTKKQIYDMLNVLNIEEMSVRSSADNEDGSAKSFAGQYETYLNVKKDNLLLSIKKCWTSILEDNVISYIGDEELNLFSVNVVVQKMINPDFAGVAFSVDPTSKSKNYLVIESCIGVGEKLVSGETTPTRYIIRREIKESDLTIGKPMLIKPQISNLSEFILKIESEYGFPVDTEWCIKDDNIYILQARPITAFNVALEPLKKVISREKKLFELNIYFNGEYFGIKELTNGLYYFNPVFHYIDDSLTNIYYNDLSLDEYPNSFFRELDKNVTTLKQKYNKVIECCDYLTSVMSNKIAFNLNDFVANILPIQPFSSLGNLAGQNWNVSDKVKDILFEYRKNHDTIIYQATDYLGKKLKEILPKNLVQYLDVLTLDEILDNSLIDTTELKKRQKGFIYYDGKIIFDTFDTFLSKQGLYLPKTKIDGNLTGNIAYGGIVKGKVKVVLSTKQFDKFNEGDILVTSMTTPKFTSLMKLASGIITDEGGVTCHASIVARELKKPCLVGCKVATELLKDDMIITLDANQGAVIIEK